MKTWLDQLPETVRPIAMLDFHSTNRNANPGLGTARNWFHATYDIPAYIYEVGDDTQPEAIRRSARSLARSYVVQLDRLR